MTKQKRRSYTREFKEEVLVSSFCDGQGNTLPEHLQSDQIIKFFKEFKIFDENYLGKKSRPMRLIILYGSSKRVVNNPRCATLCLVPPSLKSE
jgi:hypothetical protein